MKSDNLNKSMRRVNLTDKRIRAEVSLTARDVARLLVDAEGFERSRHQRKKIEMRFAKLKDIRPWGGLRFPAKARQLH